MARTVERPLIRRHIEDTIAEMGVEHPIAARRFFAALKRAYKELAPAPDSGKAWQSNDPRLSGVRQFLMPWHPNFVVFFRPNAGGVEIIHVLPATMVPV